MAVDTTHLNLFPSQLIQPNTNNTNTFVNIQSNTNVVTNQQQQQQMMRNYSALPMMNPTTLPTNYNNVVYQTNTSVNTDSGLTYNFPSDSRKRSRDFAYNNFHMSPQKNNVVVSSQLPSDFLPQIQQHQLEIDAIISQHTKKMRLELEERQKQQTRQLASAIGEGVLKKLKEKDEQIQRMSKMNFVLQERVKSLFVENQLWRDVAQSNEATANSLRSNLEHVMAHVGVCEDQVEEAESCCGSNDHGKEEKETSSTSDKFCKRCGENESTVLVLPCRHLCLCNVCGSGSQKLQTCPVCSSVMNATLHVNMSS